MRIITGEHAPIRVWGDELDENALAQLRNTASLPIIHGHVAAMPDVHWGIGATVGSVIATRSAVIPAAVGVDIGCGMCAVRTSLTASELPDSLAALRSRIEADVPVGFNMHGEDRGHHDPHGELETRWQAIEARHPGIRMQAARRRCQIGTLGGGNHFIEVCLDEDQRVWVMLHSGSRHSGKVIADYFITKAREECERRRLPLPDRDLAWLPQGTALFDDYCEAVRWAQDYAADNRRVMLRLVLGALRRELPAFEVDAEAVNCHHNYVAWERHHGADVIVTRKGAVRARAGDLGIIPGSMGARSFIVRGRGNPDSYHSCSHGAGRRMGRKQARRTYTADDLARQTEGVECRKDQGVVDEIPAAYKDIDAVMAAQSDLVEILHTLRQVVCVKG